MKHPRDSFHQLVVSSKWPFRATETCSTIAHRVVDFSLSRSVNAGVWHAPDTVRLWTARQPPNVEWYTGKFSLVEIPKENDR